VYLSQRDALTLNAQALAAWVAFLEKNHPHELISRHESRGH
jgi:hypothetical protein